MGMHYFTNKQQIKLTHIDNCTRHCTHCTYNWKALAVKIYYYYYYSLIVLIFANKKIKESILPD